MDKFPKRIDINPTARCNLCCTFCWGPDHNISDGLNTNDWKKAIKYFSEGGTKEIVFTGGEPLMRNDLVQLLRFAKKQKMNVTLSTNGILLNENRARELLPYVDEVGIPIDGSDSKKNSTMRESISCALSEKHFSCAIEALERIRRLFPTVEITVRTVVSRVNKVDILSIGKTLLEQKGKWDRWKLYQFTPESIGAKHKQKHNISTRIFTEISKKIKEAYPDFNIHACATSERIGKYVFIGPEGNIFGVGENGMYKRFGLFQKMSRGELTRAIQTLLGS